MLNIQNKKNLRIYKEKVNNKYAYAQLARTQWALGVELWFVCLFVFSFWLTMGDGQDRSFCLTQLISKIMRGKKFMSWQANNSLYVILVMMISKKNNGTSVGFFCMFLSPKKTHIHQPNLWRIWETSMQLDIYKFNEKPSK